MADPTPMGSGPEGADLSPRFLTQLGWAVWRFVTAAGNRVAASVTLGASTLSLVFERAEGTTTYGVLATPSWNTTVWVTAKTTAGCTLNFGTAAPANASVDVITFHA